MKNYLLLTLLALLLQSSCDSSDPHPNLLEPENKYRPFPEATREGLHTFGCYVNGVPWVAQVPLWGPVFGAEEDLKATYASIASTTPRENYFVVNARRAITEDEINERITMEIEGLKSEGVYELISEDIFLSPYRNVESDCESTIFYLDTLKTNQITITRFDTLAKIVSGTFEMVVYNKTCADTLVITDGRFDALINQ